jgi:uncharacterized membrane protein (DUF4010 family)
VSPEGWQDFLRLAVALAAGLLIGLDRERAELRKKREIFGGIRTFPIIALAGCVPMLVLDRVGPWLVAASFLTVAAVSLISYWRTTAQGHIGATTEVAGLATFLVGVLAGAGELLIAGAAGLAVAALLVAKPKLESISRAMTPAEVAAVLELAVISGIVLPILPNRGYGPWNALNPREIWEIVVFVTGLSFAGFVAARVLGERRGLAVTGVLGGLVSSTAVTVAMAERSHDSDALSSPAAAAAVLASSVMALRVVVMAGVINVAILPRLIPVCAVMALVGGVAARLIVHADHRKSAVAGKQLRNPFSLRQAALFAAIYAAILLATRATQQHLAQGMLFATASVGALADVDAVTIAFTRLGAADTWRVIAAAISVALIVNTLVKLVIAWVRGAPLFRRHVALALGVMALCGAVAGAVVYLRA